ncbi:MAG: endo-1,4-beta-xylanase [Planctomycetaceae bacterium]
MRFIVCPSSRIEGDLPPTQMTGFDGRSFAMRVEATGNTLVCTRQQSDSGKLHILCPVDGFGSVMLATASLRERTDPYVLALELARGTVCELRNQTGAWQVAGLRIPDSMKEPYDTAHRLFTAAVLKQSSIEECSQHAWEAIANAVKAGRLLTEAYVSQRMVFRQSRSQSLPVSLGCDTGSAAVENPDREQFESVFNSALVPVTWKTIESVEGEYDWDNLDETIDWCVQNRNFVVAGPLLDLAKGGMPSWLETWQHDFLNLQSFVADFVETAVSRYVGRVRHWEIVGNANTGGALNLTEENRLSLAARTLEVARQVDDEIQLSLMIGQPFGEYMTDGNHRLSPIQFVDALARSGIGLSEVHLDIRLGEHGNCSLPQHLLQFSKLMDLWSYLGLPLSVSLSCVGDYAANEMQLAMLERYVPVLMAKDSVVGIYWGCLRDGSGSTRNGCGLVNEDGSERETLSKLRSYRKRYWR